MPPRGPCVKGYYSQPVALMGGGKAVKADDLARAELRLWAVLEEGIGVLNSLTHSLSPLSSLSVPRCQK